MTDEQSLLDDSYSTRRDAEVEPYRYSARYVPPPTCSHCGVRLLPGESGLCTREWCVEWRKEES